MQANTSDDDEALGLPIPTTANPDTHVASSRACETCRTRKTKCDREYPCLQCQRSGIECTYAVTRPRQKRTRVLITPQYERKIDLIDDRLGTITKLLKELKTNTPVARTSQEPQYNTPDLARATTVASSPNLSESAIGPGVEGESSLSAHSVFVNEFLQDFVQPDPEIRSTLDHLSNIVSDSRQQNNAGGSPRTNVQSRSQVQQKKNELPPFPKVAALIRLAKAQRLAGSGWVYEYITMQSFGDLCLEVYFSGESTLFDRISVNAGLLSLFWDYASIDGLSETEKEQSMAYSRRCQDNLDVGLADLPLQLPASSNVVATLLFASFYALGCSKPLLCWSLVSKASEICQTLGYHRKTNAGVPRSETSSYTQFLFWRTYWVDKTLSLRLGRASTIPESEIGIDLPSLPSDDQEPVLAYFVFWTKLARCQGNIYEMLYSPGSMVQPNAVRQSRVDILRKDLEDLDRETEHIVQNWFAISKERSGENLINFYVTSDTVLRLSLMTHVCRAAPRAPNSQTTFDSRCVEVARATIEKHHDCMAIIRERNNLYFSTYVNWTLLFAPFVPFIVIFCNVMETRNQVDLARLDAFVHSIQPASTFSAHAARMYGLFQVLHKIAARYIALVMHDNPEESRIPETEAQLAAIGLPHARAFAPNEQNTQTSSPLVDMDTHLFCEPYDFGATNSKAHFSQSSVNPVFWVGSGTQLENWFYDNQMSLEPLQGSEFTPI